MRDLLHRYVSEVIYGSNDGLVTTFAVVAGVTGAALDNEVILILGFVSLLADGSSMAASDFLSHRSREARDGEDAVRGDEPPPARTALATFAAFLIAGSVPLISYIVPIPQSWRFPVAALLTGVTLFTIGAARSTVTSRSWWRNGTEMFLVGAGAAGIAFVVGRLLSDVGGGAAV
ncbi:MAG: VIT1/CCC1 transporter family protein [Nitriliruptoraceae bacterium]